MQYGNAADTSRATTHDQSKSATAVCCSCQMEHHVRNMGKPVDAYLLGPHMQQLPDCR
jgi:transcription elongation factor Elf1